MVKKRPCPQGAFYGQEGASWDQEGAAVRVKNGFEFVFLGVGIVSFHVRLYCEAELLVYKILYISISDTFDLIRK